MVCGMSDHVYKKLELVGSSTTTIEDAVQNALSLAAKTIRNMRWFEVIETRGHIEENKINHWQVTVKVGFTLERGGRTRCSRVGDKTSATYSSALMI